MPDAPDSPTMTDVTATEIETQGEDEEVLYCQWHPKVETVLRCYQCDTPICVKCARRTPVGYICPDCQRGRRQRFEQSKPADYAIAAITAVILGGVVSIVPLLNSWWFVIFLSPLAGTLISEVVWRLVRRRYGRHLWWIVTAGIVIGALPVLGIRLLRLTTIIQGNIWSLQGLLIWGLHVVMTVGSAIARLRLT
jgi:hypothetical protein